jgi:hypothetical protein
MRRERLMANGKDGNHGNGPAEKPRDPGSDKGRMPPPPPPKGILLEVIRRLKEDHQRLADDMRRLEEYITLTGWEWVETPGLLSMEVKPEQAPASVVKR